MQQNSIRVPITVSLHEAERVGFTGPESFEVIVVALYSSNPDRWQDIDSAYAAAVQILGFDPRQAPGAS